MNMTYQSGDHYLPSIRSLDRSNQGPWNVLCISLFLFCSFDSCFYFFFFFFLHLVVFFRLIFCKVLVMPNLKYLHPYLSDQFFVLFKVSLFTILFLLKVLDVFIIIIIIIIIKILLLYGGTLISTKNKFYFWGMVSTRLLIPQELFRGFC